MFGRNSGQAAVEYILMVSVAVSLIFILKGTFKSMEKFIDNYLGKYTECLMAYGELPALGVTNGDLKQHITSGTKCDTGFKAFTLAGGRPPVDGGGSSGRDKPRGKGDETSTTSSGGGGSSSSTSKKSDADVGGGSSSPYKDGQIQRGGSNTSDGVAQGSSKTKLIEEEGVDNDLGRRPRQSRTNYKERERYRSITGLQAEQIQSKLSRSSIRRTPTSKSIAKGEEGRRLGPRVGIVNPPSPKVIAEEEEQQEGWGFGQMLKWLLIIGMIIAILIFFGGQLMNYSNSE